MCSNFWIEDQIHNMPISIMVIQEKPKRLFKDLKKEYCESSSYFCEKIWIEMSYRNVTPIYIIVCFKVEFTIRLILFH